MEESRHARLNEIFAAHGSTDTNDETRSKFPHWHLRFVFNGQKVPARATSSFNDSPAFIPGIIEAEQFDIGNNTEAYYIPFTGQLDPDEKPVDVDVYNAQDGSRYVGSTSGGQWMNYTVNISSTGSYSFDTRVASSVGGTFHFEVDGVDKTGSLVIPNTGSSSAFQSVIIDDIYLDAGQHTVRLVIEGSGENVASFDNFSVNPYLVPETCNPQYGEIENCNWNGGYWDNYFCQCNYGMY